MARDNPERTRRRAIQQAHAAQAVTEAATLLPLRDEEKAALIEENKARDLARFGSSAAEAKEIAQTANRNAAELEAAQLQLKPTPVPVLIPGQQVSLQTANLLARQADAAEINGINDAARASAKAVRDTLLNLDNPVLERHQKSRAQASIAAATAAQAKE